MASAAVDSTKHAWEISGGFQLATIPDIGLPLEEQDLILSSEAYNCLLPIEKQVRLQVSHGHHIKALLAIINGHGMGDFVGAHSLHRHGTIPDETVLLEATAPGVDCMKWARATPITSELLAKDRIHVAFFKVQASNKSLIPVQFAMGPSPLKGRDIPPQFISDVSGYVLKNGLADLIAIEVGDFAKARAGNAAPTAELEVIWGRTTKEELTVVLPLDQMTKGSTSPVPTGWNVNDNLHGNVDADPPPGQHWNEATKSDGTKTHKVHVDSIEPITPALLHAALVNQGFTRTEL